jgi:hypothetical protein
MWNAFRRVGLLLISGGVGAVWTEWSNRKQCIGVARGLTTNKFRRPAKAKKPGKSSF